MEIKVINHVRTGAENKQKNPDYEVQYNRVLCALAPGAPTGNYLLWLF